MNRLTVKSHFNQKHFVAHFPASFKRIEDNMCVVFVRDYDARYTQGQYLSRPHIQLIWIEIGEC